MYLAIFTFICILSVIIGKSSHGKKLQNIEMDLSFLIEYRNRFVELVNEYHVNRSLDNQLYTYLMEKSNKTELLLGQTGRVHYMPPFTNYTIPDYPIVLNTIPKFKTGALLDFDISSSDDVLLRKIGILKEGQESLNNDDNLKTWFQIGSKAILSLPLSLLNFFGIISTNTLKSFTASSIFKVINGFVWLLALLGTLITITTGWDAFKKIIQSIL